MENYNHVFCKILGFFPTNNAFLVQHTMITRCTFSAAHLWESKWELHYNIFLYYFISPFTDVKEAKAPKKEEPEEDDNSTTNYNIASSLAETLKNIPKEDLEPPPPTSTNNDR